MFNFERKAATEYIEKNHEICFREIDYGQGDSKIRYVADSLIDKQSCELCNIESSFMFCQYDSILEKLGKLDIGIKVINYAKLSLTK